MFRNDLFSFGMILMLQFAGDFGSDVWMWGGAQGSKKPRCDGPCTKVGWESWVGRRGKNRFFFGGIVLECRTGNFTSTPSDKALSLEHFRKHLVLTPCRVRSPPRREPRSMSERPSVNRAHSGPRAASLGAANRQGMAWGKMAWKHREGVQLDYIGQWNCIHCNSFTYTAYTHGIIGVESVCVHNDNCIELLGRLCVSF